MIFVIRLAEVCIVPSRMRKNRRVREYTERNLDEFFWPFDETSSRTIYKYKSVAKIENSTRKNSIYSVVETKTGVRNCFNYVAPFMQLYSWNEEYGYWDLYIRRWIIMILERILSVYLRNLINNKVKTSNIFL